MLGLLAPVVLALPLPALQEPAPGAPQRRLEDAELEDLAKDLARYFEARESTVGLDEARVALEEELLDLRREAETDPLGLPADLERAVWLSRGYDDRREKAGKVEEQAFRPGGWRGEPMRFAFRLPNDYEGERGWPLILAIPPPDEEPDAHLRTSWSARSIKEGAIVVCPEMPGDAATWEQLIVQGQPGGLSHVLTALRLAGERFAVDFDRVYVAGYGPGVPTAVAAGNYAPQRFAGIVGRAGDPGQLAPDNFTNLPTFFAGGGADARAFQEALRSAGHDNCTVQAVAQEEELFAWMREHPRVALPDEVELVVGTPFPTRAYWLRLASADTDTRAIARVDRAENSIAIEGRGASHATLFLNDELVDLDRPLSVVVNGAEVSPWTPRKLVTALNLLADGTSDPGCVYVAQITLSMDDPLDGLAVERVERPDPDYDQRLERAGEEVALLWDLYEWCVATGRPAMAAGVLRRLLRVDPEHADARAALGHVRADAQWFTSQEALDRFQQLQDPARAEAMGWVEKGGLWMHPSERKLANKSMEKDWESGLWLSAADRRKLAKGWERQDLQWIEPDEVDRLDEGLWRVDGEWLELAQADRRRARIDSMWRVPSVDVLLYATVDREVALRVQREMASALPELVRAFGAAPALPIPACVLRDEEQYDRFAFGDPDGRRPATQANRMQVIHTAYFAESWFERVEGDLAHRGMGVCYYDTLAPNGELFGRHAARLAIGLSYTDAIDPSPKAVRAALKNGPGTDYEAGFQAEKQLPAWLRYGGAVYAERYFEDPTVAEDGDPWWTRKWSLDNLRGRGGLRPLEEVFAFDLDPDERDDGLKLLIESGLLVAFMLDGGCAPVTAAHAELKRALATGRLRPSHVEALREALIANEAALRAWAEV